MRSEPRRAGDDSGGRRIAFLITELSGGGAERSMLSIIELIDRTRFDPVLIVFDGRFDHEPPAGVPVIVLERRGVGPVGRLVSRIRQLARIARERRLDLIVSFLIGPNVVAIGAGRLAGVPVIVGERSAPHHVLATSNRALTAHKFWATLVRWLYPRADAIITNTAGAGRDLVRDLGVDPSRVAVIPNPIDIARVRALAAEPAPELPPDDVPALVHVGRFSYAKDHATLLDAFARVRANRRARLILVGDGEDESQVRALVRTRGLDDDVVFTGFTRNPYKYLARGAVCVLTSRFEGLPNALIEAMALGVPVVSTACDYGPVELIGHDACGLLAPVGDAAAVAGAVVRVLDDPELRGRLIAAGRERVQGFEAARVADAYQALLERVVLLKSSRAASR